MMAVYIVPSEGRSGRPMLASKICDIQRTDHSIDSSMRADAILMVPIRTVTSPQRPSLPSVGSIVRRCLWQQRSGVYSSSR